MSEKSGAAPGEPSRFAIVFAPDGGKDVANYVVRGFFGWRELPQALARMVLTGEFARFVGVPLLLLLAARGLDADALALGLTSLATVWLLVGLVWISRYGPSRGIACYLLEPDGSRGALVGGLRLRLQRRGRRLWIAGLLVEPAWRGRGIASALVLAALRLAEAEAARGAVEVAVFAPTHPASKAIVARHLGGLQVLRVEQPPSGALQDRVARLEAAVGGAAAAFTWDIAALAGRLFEPPA